LCYSIAVDFRRTIACLIVVLGVFFAGFVAGSPDYNGDCRKPKSAEQALVTSSSQTPNTPTHNANEADCYSPKWYATFKRPDGMLVVVGIITFIIIGWQSLETKHAAKAAADSVEAINKQATIMEQQTTATQDAAEATKKSVELQRVAMQQWIDTEDWEAGPRFIQPTATEGFLPISFTIVNNTKFKMYLDRVTVWIDREEAVSIWYRNKLLTPDGDVQPVAIERRLMGVKLESYRIGVYRFEIGGVVSYVDAFGDKQEEKFGFHCSSRMSAHADFEPIAFYPPDAAELEAQKQRKAQTQQDNPN